MSLSTLLRLTLFLTVLGTTVHAAPQALPGRVVGVTDGDTVTLLDAQHTLHKIRLAGIDAPESRMPYGQRAKAHLAALVFNKNVVALTRKQDRYGRTIATLMRGQTDINLAMIEAGMAWHYRHYAKEQPAAEARAYALAEEQARDRGIGLWHDSEPTAPWAWRRSRRTHLSTLTTVTIVSGVVPRIWINL